ncbi:MAG: fumarylacetoacetate hydrolase family protein [Verrucomicrobiales bacterium]|nr:fumarylacetoacetate hydrolase family protein [Verrucomicrobiales bacterium]
MPYRIFRSASSVFVEDTESPGLFRHLDSGFAFNNLFSSDEPLAYLADQLKTASDADSFNPEIPFHPPIGDQEIWASGVTYFRSRTARMEEAETAGGDVFYDKVYDAERPELFFKSSAHRARGHLDKVGIRHDSTWDVPEPEFTLAISSSGKIFGYTIGNDMSSRSIEGENPLYLPQAKSYTGACAIGPCLVVGEIPALENTISISIRRSDEEVFSGETALNQIKRSFEELAGFLFRCNDFAHGAYLMTGTGIVPDSDFTLQVDDEVAITIEGIGTLTNVVEKV